VAEEQSTRFYFEIEVIGEEAAKKAAELQEQLTKALTESVKPTKSLAEAFGELDKRIAGVNDRVTELLKKFPLEMQEAAKKFEAVIGHFASGMQWIDKDVKKTLKVIVTDFEDLSDEIVGKSIVTDMVDKIAKEFEELKAKHGSTIEEMKQHWEKYVEAARRILAEFYTIKWSEKAERGIRGLASNIRDDIEKLKATVTGPAGLAGVLRVRAVTGAGALPIAPPIELPSFTQQIKAWATDFAAATQQASIATWGLRRMGFMFQQMGSQIESSGKQIISTLKGMVDSYLEFNGVMAKTGASVGLTADATADLSDEVVKAAKAIGFISPEKIATGWNLWAQAEGSLVETAEQRNKVLAQSLEITKLADMRNADLGNTINTVSGIMTVFNKDISELPNVLALMNFATAKSSMTLGDFGTLMQGIGPIVEDMNMTFEDAIAMQLLLAKVNIRGSTAMTAMRSILQSLAEPSADFTTAMNKLVGVEVPYSWLNEFEDRLPTIAEYVNLLARNVVNLSDADRQILYGVLTNNRAQAALTVLVNAQTEAMGRNADAFQEAMVSNQEALGYWGRTWVEYEKQDSVRAQKMKQRWDEVARSIGKSLIEAGIEPAEALSELLDKVTKFTEEHPAAVPAIAGGAIGGIAIGKLMTLLGASAQVLTLIMMLWDKGVITTLAKFGAGVVGKVAVTAVGAAPIAVPVGIGAVMLLYAKARAEERAQLDDALYFFAEADEATLKVIRDNIERFKRRTGPGPADYDVILRATTALGAELLGGAEVTYDLQEKERLLAAIVEHLREIRAERQKETPTLTVQQRGLLAGPPLPALPPPGGITTEAGIEIPAAVVEDFKSRMFEFVTDMKEIEDTYRHDSIQLTEQAREQKLAVIEAYDDRELAANVNLVRQLEAIDMSAATSKERAKASHVIRLEQMLESHHKALIRAEEDFVRQMARAADDYARSEARAQEDFDAQRGKSRKQSQEDEARDAEQFKLKMERLEKDHVDKLYDLIVSRDARGFIKEMISYARRKKEAQEDYDLRRRDARSSQVEQESDAQANFDKARRRAQEDYERQRALAEEQYEFARARRIADYEDQRKLARAAFVEQLRLINEATRDRTNAAYRAAVLAMTDRDAAEVKELDSIDENLAKQLTKLEDALKAQRGVFDLHFWGWDGILAMRDQFTDDEFQAIKDAHDDEMFFYNNTVLPDTETVYSTMFQIVKGYTEDIAKERAKAQADWDTILEIQAKLAGVTGTPKQFGGYAPYGTYKLGESGREFVLSNVTTRALESRVGTLSQGAMVRLGSNGSNSRAPISVVLRQENWQFVGALSAAEKAELREMARIGALEAFDEVTQKAWD